MIFLLQFFFHLPAAVAGFGVFASKAVNPAGVDGLLAGSAAQLAKQGLGILVVGVYAFIVSLGILKAVNAIASLRMAADAESVDMDISEHSETAYRD